MRTQQMRGDKTLHVKFGVSRNLGKCAFKPLFSGRFLRLAVRIRDPF